jgi:hypothetical protein
VGAMLITTLLDKDEVLAAQVVRYYRSLQNVEHRFRVLKDFFELRPPLDRGPRAGPRGALRAGGHHRGRHGRGPR